MGAPAELGRLHAFGDETLHRPGVDEHVHRLRLLGALGVALGDMDALDAELHGKLAPAFAALRLVDRRAGVAGDVDQRLLDEPGHHAGIGAAGGDRGGAARAFASRFEQRLAQRIVRAFFCAHALVEIEAGPRFDDGVDIERADFPAHAHDVDRRGVDREVDAKALAAAFGEQRHQQFAIIVLCHRLLDEAHAVLLRELAVLMRIDDDKARSVIGEMPFDQRQRALADRAEADHDDGAGNLRVNRRGGAHVVLCLRKGADGQGGGIRRCVAWRSLRPRSSSRACRGRRRPEGLRRGGCRREPRRKRRNTHPRLWRR